MDIQLLFKEADVKGLLSLSDNMYSEFMRSAMYEAQEVYYVEVIGESMLDTLKRKAADGELTGIYRTLVEKSLPYLCYMTMARLVVKATFKLSNIGAHTNTDENISTADKAGVDNMIEDAEAQAMAHLRRLQRWLCDNASQLPELKGANLHSATDCGIWLGGYRAQFFWDDEI